MSESRHCLVMLGDVSPDWSEIQPKGIVSVSFRDAGGSGSYDLSIVYTPLSFEEALQEQAIKRGANLVCGLVFTPVPVATGSSAARHGALVVTGNAYYVAELDSDRESSDSTSSE